MLISCIYHGYEGIAVFKCIYLCEIILNAKQTKSTFRVWFYLGLRALCSFIQSFVRLIQYFLSLSLSCSVAVRECVATLLLLFLPSILVMPHSNPPLISLLFSILFQFFSSLFFMPPLHTLPWLCSQSSCTPYSIQSKFSFFEKIPQIFNQVNLPLLCASEYLCLYHFRHWCRMNASAIANLCSLLFLYEPACVDFLFTFHALVNARKQRNCCHEILIDFLLSVWILHMRWSPFSRSYLYSFAT